MGTADQPNSHMIPPQGGDLEEQGLRVLAKIIARKLAESRRDKDAREYKQGAGDSSASGDAG